MTFVISIFISLLIIVALFPFQLLNRKNLFVTSDEHNKEIRTSDIQNSLALSIMNHSKKLSKVFRVRIKDLMRDRWEKQISYAGMKNSINVDEFYGLKVYLALVTGVFFSLVLLVNYSMMNLTLAFVASLMGYYVPDNWMRMRGKNRQWTIQKEMPSILSALAIITDAGMNLMQALEVVTAQNTGVLCDELKKVTEDIRIGISHKEAFIRLSQRTDVDEMSYFVSAITQGLEKGNSGITKVIKEQAQESWEKRKYKAKELAEQASMKLFMPLLLLVFPAFMIYLIGPMVFSLLQMFR